MTDELVNEISDLCFYESPDTEGNILVTFGSNVGVRAAARKTMQELKRGLAKILALTGGVSSAFPEVSELRPGQSEAQAIYEAIFADPGGADLLHRTEYLFVEKMSLNTLENVANLQKRLKFFPDDTVVCVCHAYSARRVFLTMKKYFPHIEVRVSPFELKVPVTKDLTVNMTRQSWFKGQISRALVWGEVLRMEAYGARGDIRSDIVSDGLDRIRALTAGANRGLSESLFAD